MVDGPANGPAPPPWSIAAQPSQVFHDHEKCFEVPHTASVRACHNCAGVGANRCWRCRGRGRVSEGGREGGKGGGREGRRGRVGE